MPHCRQRKLLLLRYSTYQRSYPDLLHASWWLRSGNPGRRLFQPAGSGLRHRNLCYRTVHNTDMLHLVTASVFQEYLLFLLLPVRRPMCSSVQQLHPDRSEVHILQRYRYDRSRLLVLHPKESDALQFRLQTGTDPIWMLRSHLSARLHCMAHPAGLLMRRSHDTEQHKHPLP